MTYTHILTVLPFRPSSLSCLRRQASLSPLVLTPNAREIPAYAGMTRSLLMVLLCLTIFTITGCASTMDKLENIGNPPPLTKMEDPTTRRDYQPMTWPTPKATPEQRKYSNSLWQPGARAFFRDQRASRVGDILKVKIMIDDKAELDNSTERTRTSQENVAAPDVYGLESLFGTLTPGSPNPSSLFDISGNTTNTGEGTVEREEKIETEIAAIITQILPNGNFVIEGNQEIRVNFEIREIFVSGVVRPEDISSQNSVESSQIAQARIAYGGRGQLTDVQQPRWGSQAVDILSPF